MTTATIKRWGNSLGLRLPKVFLDAQNLEEGDEVMVTITPIKKKPTHDTLMKAFESFSGSTPSSVDWGDDVGNEIVAWTK